MQLKPVLRYSNMYILESEFKMTGLDHTNIRIPELVHVEQMIQCIVFVGAPHVYLASI